MTASYRARSSHRVTRLSWLLLVLLVVLTFTFGIIGWYNRAPLFGVTSHGPETLENTLFLCLRAFIIDGVYIDQSRTGNSPWLVAARWTGAATFAWSLVTAFITLSQERISRWRAILSRGHTLVVGDHAVAAALIARARHIGLGVLHVSDGATESTSAAGYLTLPRHLMLDDAGLSSHADLILVAESDTGASAETALTLTRGMDLAGGDAKVRVHLDDPVAAEGFHHLPGGYDIVTFSLAQAAAREVLLRHPPFIVARKKQAQAIHVLMVGFGRLGESLLADILVNSVSAGLGEPWITVVDEDAAAAERSFSSRYPEAGKIGRIRFVKTLDNDAFEDLSHQLGRTPPVCAAYICIPSSADAFSAAIALRDRALRDSLFEAPIFVYLPSGGGLPRQLAGAARYEEIPLLGFGDVDDVVLVSQALDRDADNWPKQVNLAYAEVYARVYGGSVTPAPWRTLPEPMRQSNRRVITHIPAKLASLGFDLTPLIEAPLSQRLELPALHPDHPMFRGDADRLVAAELEHRRWAADRQLSGWRLGKRDNRRRFHPDLIPFEDLSDAVQAFDFAVNDWLDAVLPRRPDGLKRLGETGD